MNMLNIILHAYKCLQLNTSQNIFSGTTNSAYPLSSQTVELMQIHLMVYEHSNKIMQNTSKEMRTIFMTWSFSPADLQSPLCMFYNYYSGFYLSEVDGWVLLPLRHAESHNFSPTKMFLPLSHHSNPCTNHYIQSFLSRLLDLGNSSLSALIYLYILLGNRSSGMLTVFASLIL